MQSLMFLLVPLLAVIVSCNAEVHNHSRLTTFDAAEETVSNVFSGAEIANHSQQAASNVSTEETITKEVTSPILNTTESSETLLNYNEKINFVTTESVVNEWDHHDFMNEDEDSTEILGIDANGCDRDKLKHYDGVCDESYERVNSEAQEIKNDLEKTEAVCCALEDYEKCNLKAYDRANCAANKTAIRENLRAARLFLIVIANVTCSEYRGQCAYYSSAVSGYASHIVVIGSVLIQLVRLL